MELVKPEITRDELGRLVAGSPSLNPHGRPKGQSMKEFAREFLMAMTPEEKGNWLKGLSPEIIWRMSEGNPHTTTDLTSGDKPLQTVLVQFIDKQEDAKDNTDSV